MISTHSSAANRMRIGHDRSILCLRGTPKAGSAMVMEVACPSSFATADGAGCDCRSLRLGPEDLRVARLDLLARLLDAGGIVLPKLDLVEPARARLLLDQRVDGMLAGEIDQQLLRLKRVQPVLEQARGVRVGRPLEHRARAGDQRR